MTAVLWLMFKLTDFLSEQAIYKNNHRMADNAIVIYDALNEIKNMIRGEDE